jgi:hypothetical protein
VFERKGYYCEYLVCSVHCQTTSDEKLRQLTYLQLLVSKRHIHAYRERDRERERDRQTDRERERVREREREREREIVVCILVVLWCGKVIIHTLTRPYFSIFLLQARALIIWPEQHQSKGLFACLITSTQKSKLPNSYRSNCSNRVG